MSEKTIVELKATAEDLFELTKAEASHLVNFAIDEITSEQIYNVRRARRFQVQTCLWLNKESMEILEHLTKLAKKSGQLSKFERKQDYLRNLVYREFVNNLRWGR